MNHELPDDLPQRILALLDGALPAEEVSRLDGELCADPEARVLYRQLATLHSALEEQGAARSEIRRIPLIPVERLLAEQNLRMVRHSLLAAAAVLLLSALVLWMKMAPRAPDTLAEFRVGPDTAFTLTHADDGKAPRGLVLGEGSRLELAHGTLEAKFDSGVRCVVEGPAELYVLAENRVSIAEGVAWFGVPPPAVGFTVETPNFTAVDLGTEFGVVVRADRDHELHVTKGSVEMRSGTTEEGGRKLVLKAGQARRVDAGGEWHEIPTENDRFTTILPESIMIANPSFDADDNRSVQGMFSEGDALGNFRGNLSGWSTVTSTEAPLVGNSGIQVGWKDILSSELHPQPPVAGRESQALSLMTGASVLNTTATAWSSLRVGDKLTLTVSLGMRGGPEPLDWNEETFFGLTDGGFSPAGIPTPADTVAHSGLITANPATGSQSGNGTFKDVSFEHTIQEADIRRQGRIGILLVSISRPPWSAPQQSFFDNVRLQHARASSAAPSLDD